MRTGKPYWILAVAALAAVPALAQESEEAQEARMREAEARIERELEREQNAAREKQAEMERLAEQMKADAMALAERRESASEEYEARMREAEQRMAEAARQMAQLSMLKLPQVERIERAILGNRGPVLGVTVGGYNNPEPVEGVEILGVTPGGAAQDAGLRAGDVLTSVNGESLTAETGMAAKDALLDFMSGVEEGDELDFEFLRGGRTNSVTVSPRPIEFHSIAIQLDGENIVVPDVHVVSSRNDRGGAMSGFVWLGQEGGFGDMEMVKLTERLGTYFGAEDGLLVVRAPGNEALKLEDGDVILNIHGRTPDSVSHALRILGSYQAGETLEIEIMRDKRKQTIEIEMPDNRRSWVSPANPPQAPVPSVAPTAVVAPVP